MSKKNLFFELAERCDLSMTVTRVAIGLCSVMVETQFSTGLSACFREPGGCQIVTISDAGNFVGRKLDDLVRPYENGSLLQKSIAMAALNAGIVAPPETLPSLYGQDFMVEKTGNGHLVVVGDFPFVDNLRDQVGKLSLIQERPHLGYLGVARARELFPEARTIVITASAFINETMEDLLDLAEDAYVIILGSTTPLTEYLFSKGVNALCGTIVEDSEAVFSGVTQGVSFRKLSGARRVTWFNSSNNY
ncbi:DUF364 domain-containing protein [bacterium]|nr:DUF364 domain-containing protein [bacterium]